MRNNSRRRNSGASIRPMLSLESLETRQVLSGLTGLLSFPSLTHTIAAVSAPTTPKPPLIVQPGPSTYIAPSSVAPAIASLLANSPLTPASVEGSVSSAANSALAGLGSALGQSSVASDVGSALGQIAAPVAALSNLAAVPSASPSSVGPATGLLSALGLPALSADPLADLNLASPVETALASIPVVGDLLSTSPVGQATGNDLLSQLPSVDLSLGLDLGGANLLSASVGLGIGAAGDGSLISSDVAVGIGAPNQALSVDLNVAVGSPSASDGSTTGGAGSTDAGLGLSLNVGIGNGSGLGLQVGVAAGGLTIGAAVGSAPTDGSNGDGSSGVDVSVGVGGGRGGVAVNVGIGGSGVQIGVNSPASNPSTDGGSNTPVAPTGAPTGRRRRWTQAVPETKRPPGPERQPPPRARAVRTPERGRMATRPRCTRPYRAKAATAFLSALSPAIRARPRPTGPPPPSPRRVRTMPSTHGPRSSPRPAPSWNRRRSDKSPRRNSHQRAFKLRRTPPRLNNLPQPSTTTPWSLKRP